MKSSKKLQISSHLLFVYINNKDRKWRMSVLVFSSALLILAFKMYCREAQTRNSVNRITCLHKTLKESIGKAAQRINWKQSIEYVENNPSSTLKTIHRVCWKQSIADWPRKLQECAHRSPADDYNNWQDYGHSNHFPLTGLGNFRIVRTGVLQMVTAIDRIMDIATIFRINKAVHNQSPF